jgi:hypothetical protein
VMPIESALFSFWSVELESQWVEIGVPILKKKHL